jgi:RNA polymerase sigma factor (sigma-70 family)
MGPPLDRDEEWFTANYAEHHDRIVRYGLRRLADADAAVELAQEVFVVAWRRRARQWLASNRRATPYSQGRLCSGTSARRAAAQEVFVVAWRRRAEVPEHSLPWLYGVARRLLANHWRARRAAPRVVPMADPELLRDGPLAGPNDRDAAVELAGVRTALATLSDLDQEILRLVGWEELTVGEAATVLGCTRATAGVRLHRARRRLVAALTTSSTPVHRTRPTAVQP